MQTMIECGFSLKRVRDMMRTYVYICRFASGVRTALNNIFVNEFLLIPTFGRFSNYVRGQYIPHFCYDNYIIKDVFYVTGSSMNICSIAVTLFLMVVFQFLIFKSIIYDSKEMVQFKHQS